MDGYIEAGAKLSPDGKYRYRLWREWRGTHDPKNWHWVTKDGDGDPMGEPKSCLFVMLNPSTADGDKDDPTIRRCVGFAKALKYERLEVVNLFAYRATRPTDLLDLNHADDPVGPWNLEIVTAAAEKAGIVICAWGAHGGHLGQDETVLGWLDTRAVHALGLTRDGHPRHPLYLPAGARPTPFRRGVT
jgi:hypothetical protein